MLEDQWEHMEYVLEDHGKIILLSLCLKIMGTYGIASSGTWSTTYRANAIPTILSLSPHPFASFCLFNMLGKIKPSCLSCTRRIHFKIISPEHYRNKLISLGLISPSKRTQSKNARNKPLGCNSIAT